MDSQNTYQYLILGGGMAGLMFAHQLQKAGKTFLIMDEQDLRASGKIAAGMFNPISGKRMSVNWKANELLNTLYENFEEVEKLCRKTYLVKANILQAFGSVKEANDFNGRLDNEKFKSFVNPSPDVDSPLIDEFGQFEVSGSGWVKTKEWITDFQNYFIQKRVFVSQKFDTEKLNYNANLWHYGDYSFEKVLCCEGSRFEENTYFNWLPFKLSKGQVLLISCKGLNPNYILKRGAYLVHQQDDIYKAGATYEWNFTDAKPTEEGKATLVEKVKQMISLPFEIVDHLAGIRPTTRDRGAILGKHPQFHNLFVFNGLGTKGILQAPFLASHLYNHIELGKALYKEADIKRFESFYTNSH